MFDLRLRRATMLLVALSAYTLPLEAEQFCPIWRYETAGRYWFGYTPAQPVDESYAHNFSVDPGNSSYALQSCSISGTFPNKSALCSVDVTCGPPNCTSNQTWEQTVWVNQLANPYVCPPGWTPSKDVPCACDPPQHNLLKASGYCSTKVTTKGDPCDASNGNVHETEADYVGTGVSPLRFVRAYNSLVDRYTFGPSSSAPALSGQQVGVGWAATYFQRLIVSAYTSAGTPSIVYALRPSGQLVAFTLTNGVLAPDSDIADVLTVTSSGFQYHAADDSIETYDPDGHLLTVSARGEMPVTVLQDCLGAVPDRSERRLRPFLAVQLLHKCIRKQAAAIDHRPCRQIDCLFV